MKNEIEQKIFEKMKAKDFGESMCNETKMNVLKWTMQQLRKHDVSGRSEQLVCDKCVDGLIKSKSFIKGTCVHCRKEIEQTNCH